MKIKGQYFDGRLSAKLTLTLECNASGQIVCQEIDSLNISISDIDISPRVGNTKRYLDFPDGAQFETDDNDAIDNLENSFKPNKHYQFIHRLESAKKIVIASLMMILLGGWLFIQYGIPYLSREVAMALPEETSNYLGKGVLKSLDKQWLNETTLDEEKRDRYTQLFTTLKTRLKKPNTRLEFRSSEFIGANAFALPNGVVVITDQLVELSSEDNEITAILLHELGHVENRHILRSMIQSFGMTFFIMAISGDVSTASTVIATGPLLFIQAGYSQNMEIEADTYSLNYMLDNNIDPTHFVRIMNKLEASHSFAFKKCKSEEDSIYSTEDCINIALEQGEQEDKTRTIGSYLSTHPTTEERTARFKKPKKDISSKIN